MKLSEHTMTILKNFASINSGVVLEKGNLQKTMHPEKSVLVEAELDETIPERLGIYDLNQFLGNVTTLDNPDLEFTEKSISMKDDTFSLFYLSCSPELIVAPPEKGLSLDNPDVEFELPNAMMAKILRLASMNNLPHLSILGESGEIRIQTHEKANPSSTLAAAKLSDYEGKDFIATFRVETLKIIPDDYTVAIKNDAFAKFTSKTKKLTYYIALSLK